MVSQKGTVFVDYEAAIHLLNSVLASEKQEPLNPLEQVILQGSWDNLQYDQIASLTDYNFDYVRAAGGELYQKLSEVLGIKLTKRNFKIAIERWASQRPVEKAPATEVEGDYLPQPTAFYGRTIELKRLETLVTQVRCVFLTGAGGIGKTALGCQVAKTAIATPPDPPFNQVVWLSLYDLPTINELVKRLVNSLLIAQEVRSEQPSVSELIQLCQAQRCLIFLDGVERVSHNPEYDHQLFLRLVKAQHQSCIVLISRSAPSPEIERAKNDHLPIQIFDLEGLDYNSAKQILESYELQDEPEWEELIKTYRGNPLFLSRVAENIRDYFGGSVQRSRSVSTILTRTISSTLTQQVGTLTSQEESLLYSLAQCPSLTFPELRQLIPDIRSSALYLGLQTLVSRGIVEAREVGEDKQCTYSLNTLLRKHILTTYH